MPVLDLSETKLSSWQPCGSVLWACDQNCVDNSQVFSSCWAVLTQPQGLSCCSCCHPVRRLWLHQKLGEGSARTADPADQSNVPHNFRLRNKSCFICDNNSCHFSSLSFQLIPNYSARLHSAYGCNFISLHVVHMVNLNCIWAEQNL